MILLGLVGFSIAGLTRLRLETNILEVLPRELASVDALKVYQERFDEDHQLILLLEGEEEIFEEDVESFVLHLRERLSDSTVLYRSELEDDPALLAESLAEVWRYAPPEDVERLGSRLLEPEVLKKHLEEVKEGIGSSFDQQKSTFAAYDPLGFLEHRGMTRLMESEFSFQNEEATSQLILITKGNPARDYASDALWLEKVRKAADTWTGLAEFGLSCRLTGGPAFSAEIGAGMEEDMSGTVSITMILVGLLFLLVQRHPGQLAMIGLLLGLVFLVTLGIGGWVFGTLNLVSVGFAAILLGLVVDYAVVICRDAAGAGRSVSELRSEIAPSILWAAFTTAIVFGLLTLSTFTGVRQLGGLIMIGLVTGAVVMLIFVPVFLKRFPGKEAKMLLKAPFLKTGMARGLVGLCLAGAAVVFAVKGEPGVSFDFSMVQPSNSEAAAAFETIQKDYPAFSDRNLQVIISADSWEELRESAEAVEKKLAATKEAGVVESFQLPVDFIPDRAFEAKNEELLREIAREREKIVEVMMENGFSESGVALDSSVLAALDKPTESDALTKGFVNEGDDGRFYFSGQLRTKDEITAENVGTLAGISEGNAAVTGWPILQAVLLPSVKRDFYVIFLPAAGVLLGALLLVFRNWKDAAIAIGVLLTVLAVVNAIVVVSGQAWNFLSGMAIPLIIGTGIDYSIHLIFALRRTEGDFDKVWNGVGKAICFCGISTSIGFGSLAFASNEMLRSMGILCSAGVLLTTGLSVLVVPGLWKRVRH